MDLCGVTPKVSSPKYGGSHVFGYNIPRKIMACHCFHWVQAFIMPEQHPILQEAEKPT